VWVLLIFRWVICKIIMLIHKHYQFLKHYKPQQQFAFLILHNF
jgi:hypothetical protein